jgi:hypothetical protein
MGRRTSGQQTGFQSIGNIQANASTLTTSQTNQDLTIDPNGTGVVNVSTDTTITGDLTIANQGDLRLREASGNGTNYIAQQAAATMAANYTITWPAAVSTTAGFVLTSDASGNLSWASAGGNIPVSDPGSTATVHYPFFGTASGSIPTTLSPLARSNLSFVPSTGVLSATTFSGAVSSSSVTITGGTINGTTIGATTRANGSFSTLTATSVTEDSSIVLKENINPIENALENILKLSGVTYDRIDTKEHEAGLIAEWVDQVIPDLVTKNKYGKPIGIKYTKITAYLIESIKSLKQEINELKSNK